MLIEIRIRRLKKSLPKYDYEETSIGDSIDCEGYLAICRLAAVNDSVFRIFRRTQYYRSGVENASKEEGKEILKLIKEKDKDLLKLLPKFSENDLYGAPIKYNYEIGQFSPTTLRYAKVLMDIKAIFGVLTNFDIVEIGAGYGGQCKIISDVYDFKSYTIVDLDGVLPLIQKYLLQLNVKNVIYKTQQEIDPENEYDLLISNYAFSECVKSVQSDYIDKILNRSKRGYIIYNYLYDYHSPNLSGSPYNKEEIIQILSRKHNIHIVDERPRLSQFDFVILWDDTRIGNNVS